MHKYRILLPEWKQILNKKWLLIDAVAVNIMADLQASGLIQELQLVASCIYIHPVLLEVMRTDRKSLLAPRLTILRLCNEFPFTRIIKPEKARGLQQALYTEGARPSPTDLYLGTILQQFSDMFLLTENVKDFPFPFFERVGYIVIEGEKSSRLLSILHARQKPQ